jgi:hypothetical protein
VHCQRKNKIFNALLMICWLSIVAVPAAAQVYKWVDDKGVTHYGERPPQGKDARALESRPAASPPPPATSPGSGAQDWQAKEQDLRRRRVAAEQAEDRQKQQDKATATWCSQARDQLKQLQAAGSVYHLNDKGERVFQSDAERNATLARYEQQIAQHCR